ncbi:hypothetical protein GOP47_0002584 [Adiantum capillus-veneris]|uniref:Dirigent protein n=1 Tax=Adiantum capillus-veneris TaxID=13818 RepID=A0A9D4ZR31_ADICA|nr:hypothetical protein GOP47_0002584 [Adiantum capillus-veneris]
MAARQLISVVVLQAMVLLSMAHMSRAERHESSRKRLPCGPSTFTFYLHNTVYNPNVDNRDYFNSVYGRPPNVSFANPFWFGVQNTFEDPLTAGPANDSKSLGKAHGFYVLDSFKEFMLFHIFTANITSGRHRGTLDIFGQVREVDPVRYLSVIGGTGSFLGARGLASCKLVQIDRVPPAKWTLSFDLDLYY